MNKVRDEILCKIMNYAPDDNDSKRRKYAKNASAVATKAKTEELAACVKEKMEELATLYSKWQHVLYHKDPLSDYINRLLTKFKRVQIKNWPNIYVITRTKFVQTGTTVERCWVSIPQHSADGSFIRSVSEERRKFHPIYDNRILLVIRYNNNILAAIIVALVLLSSALLVMYYFFRQ